MSAANNQMLPQLARSLHLTYAENRMRLPWKGVGSTPRSAAPLMPHRGVVETMVTAGSDVGVRRIVSSTPTVNSFWLKFWKKLALASTTGGPSAADCVVATTDAATGTACATGAVR